MTIVRERFDFFNKLDQEISINVEFNESTKYFTGILEKENIIICGKKKENGGLILAIINSFEKRRDTPLLNILSMEEQEMGNKKGYQSLSICNEPDEELTIDTYGNLINPKNRETALQVILNRLNCESLSSKIIPEDDRIYALSTLV